MIYKQKELLRSKSYWIFVHASKRLKLNLFTILFAMLTPFFMGCSSMTGYLRDRALDATDILTITVGVGIGAGCRAGPLHAGLGAYIDGYGIRGGDFVVFEGIGQGFDSGATCEMTIISEDTLLNDPTEQYYALPFTLEQILGASHDRYVYKYHDGVIGKPFIAIIDEESQEIFLNNTQKEERNPFLRPYYTQVDAFAGALVGVRIGINPGELLDFCFGFAAIDLYKDDDSSVLAKEAKEKAQNEAKQAEITNKKEIERLRH